MPLSFCRHGGGIQHVYIKRSCSQPSGKGPAEYFTGTVRVDPLFQSPEPARALGVSVTFEPGARTAWHTHPLGQTLIVTAGGGPVQSWGGPLRGVRPGDGAPLRLPHEDRPRKRGDDESCALDVLVARGKPPSFDRRSQAVGDGFLILRERADDASSDGFALLARLCGHVSV